MVVVALVVSGFVLLLASGVRHARWRRQFAEQLRAQGIWPPGSEPRVAVVVTAAELVLGGVGLALLAAGASATTLLAPLAALLLVGLGFTVIQVLVARHSPGAPCGCDPTHDDPVGPATLVRAVWPAAVAVVGLLAFPADGLDDLAGAALGLLLAVAVDFLPTVVRSKRSAQR